MAKTNYKKVELEIRDLVQQTRNGTTSIYEIATRCVLLLNASDSYAIEIGIKPDHVIDHLNGYLQDFAVNLEDVLTMLKVFPNREQWNKPLRQLLDDADKVIQTESKRDAENQINHRRTAKVADLEAAKNEIRTVQQELSVRESEIERVKAENKRLLEENEQLKSRVAELRGQIAELRRTKREPVAA